jgi:hypothetical protein
MSVRNRCRFPACHWTGPFRLLDTSAMTRVHHALALSFILLFNASSSHAKDCGRETTNDICVAGSPWSDFTQFRVQSHGKGISGTTTLTTHGRGDFSVDTEDARATHGTIIVVGGRAMLMKDVPHESGYEIDALDGTLLIHQLVMTLLDQAFPKGPSSVGVSAPIKIAEKKRAISIATPSAEGRFAAPWSVTGTARRDADRIEYDLQFVFPAAASRESIGFSGFWEYAPVPPLDDHMSLDGWTVHWLAPMTSASEQGTIVDYGAKPTSEHWADLAALRKYIADGLRVKP